MNHYTRHVIFKSFIFFLLLCSSLEAKIEVLVSIAPQKYLAERIGGDHLSVSVIVPAGANSHTYEPTARQIISASHGKIWFRIGESFENRLIQKLKNVEIVDQRIGLDLIQSGCGCCLQDSHDPHIWLSPKLLKKQASQMEFFLSQIEPDHAPFFFQNLCLLLEDLDQLDLECKALFQDGTQKVILVSHPAFGYFCRDYGLEQVSIEMEGKEPTPRYILDLLSKARLSKIKTVFLQKQHNPKGGITIAKEIGATTQYIDPYVENVIENIKLIAKLFNQA